MVMAAILSGMYCCHGTCLSRWLPSPWWKLITHPNTCYSTDNLYPYWALLTVISVSVHQLLMHCSTDYQYFSDCHFPTTLHDCRWWVAKWIGIASCYNNYNWCFSGGLNFKVCSNERIPLYLIVVGCCLCLEIVIHTSTILASMNTERESINRSLRLCDCFAFFILIWILIGSNWIFKVSMTGKQSCSDDTSNEGSLAEAVSDVTTPVANCTDCSDGVYRFAIAIVSLQYIAVCSVLLICCCVIIRKKTNWAFPHRNSFLNQWYSFYLYYMILLRHYAASVVIVTLVYCSLILVIRL